MEYVIIALCAIIIALLVALIVVTRKKGSSSLSNNDLEKISSAQARELSSLGVLIANNNETSSKHFIEMLNFSLKSYEKTTQDRLNSIDKTIERSLEQIRNENNQRLDSIRAVVDEKLQKSIDEKLKSSFESIVLQIGNVNKAIGEIRSIADDVGSLKNVLANVKVKGITGEVLLGGIISEILAPDQYDKDVVTKKSTRDVVEFAIKIPNGEGYIYLPVDSKLPLTPYTKLREAIDSGDKVQIDTARRELRAQIRAEAKTIATKYIDIPSTTDFAILFLPIESLYVEAIEMGLFEECQHDFRVSICGPTTFSALINALKLGFSSIEIQKRSSEVFKLLAVVRAEFERFAEALSSTQRRFKQVENDLEELVGKRTRLMQRRLEGVAQISLDNNLDFEQN